MWETFWREACCSVTSRGRGRGEEDSLSPVPLTVRFWVNPCPLSDPVLFLLSRFPVSLRLVPSKAEVCRDGTKPQVAGLKFFSFMNIRSMCSVCICLSGHVCAHGVCMHLCMCDNKKTAYRGVAMATASPYCMHIGYQALATSLSQTPLPLSPRILTAILGSKHLCSHLKMTNRGSEILRGFVSTRK